MPLQEWTDPKRTAQPLSDTDSATSSYFFVPRERAYVLENDYRLGFGTYSLTGEDGTATVKTAIEEGFRHVDTARLYGNESEVGDAIDRASVDRGDIFVATKVAHFEEPEKTSEYVRNAVEESRDRLGVDTIDLLYHHWPRGREDIDTVLPVLGEFVEEGTVEHLGVSNYTIEDIDHAQHLVDVPLYANQVELHPLLQQEELRAYLRDNDMYAVAYSPLAQGTVFDVPELQDVAEKHETTPAAVSLAWLLAQDGVAAIPRTSSEEHIRANLAARDLNLDEDDLETIASIDETLRCEDPDWMEW